MASIFFIHCSLLFYYCSRAGFLLIYLKEEEFGYLLWFICVCWAPLFRFLGIRRGIAVLGLRSMRGVIHKYMYVYLPFHMGGMIYGASDVVLMAHRVYAPRYHAVQQKPYPNPVLLGTPSDT